MASDVRDLLAGEVKRRRRQLRPQGSGMQSCGPTDPKTGRSTDPVLLKEIARRRLGGQVSRPLCGHERLLMVPYLRPAAARRIVEEVAALLGVELELHAGEVRELPPEGPARDVLQMASDLGLPVVVLRGGPGRYVYRRREWSLPRTGGAT